MVFLTILYVGHGTLNAEHLFIWFISRYIVVDWSRPWELSFLPNFSLVTSWTEGGNSTPNPLGIITLHTSTHRSLKLSYVKFVHCLDWRLGTLSKNGSGISHLLWFFKSTRYILCYYVMSQFLFGVYMYLQTELWVAMNEHKKCGKVALHWH